jgi:hypothetical protein
VTTADITQLRKDDESKYITGTKKSSIAELKQVLTEISAEQSYWHKLLENNDSRIELLEVPIIQSIAKNYKSFTIPVERR